MPDFDIERHNREIAENLKAWERKPLLQKVYRDFHRIIAQSLQGVPKGLIVELGSGIGNIREEIPDCLRTDLFDNPWIDQSENAYDLSFDDESLAALILFDVFHHLRYPGNAFDSFYRVLKPGGRIAIFEPCLSLLGKIVYGRFHPEPVAMNETIKWKAGNDWSPREIDYYAAQSNAMRIFLWGEGKEPLVRNKWKEIELKRAFRTFLCAFRRLFRSPALSDFRLSGDENDGFSIGLFSFHFCHSHVDRA